MEDMRSYHRGVVIRAYYPTIAVLFEWDPFGAAAPERFKSRFGRLET
jgi:hypothetical protein